MRSVVVVLPASICAIMPIFLILLIIVFSCNCIEYNGKYFFSATQAQPVFVWHSLFFHSRVLFCLAQPVFSQPSAVLSAIGSFFSHRLFFSGKAI